MSDFRAYLSLLKVELRNSLVAMQIKPRGKSATMSLDGKEKDNSKAKAKKVFTVIGMVVLSLMILGYLISFAVQLSTQAIENGLEKDFLYSALLIVQIAILFLGGVVVLNNLYFGRDNQLLMNLPVKSSVIFAAKFSVSYISQLLLSALVTLPLLITFGITSKVIGGTVYGAEFYILAILSVFLLPIVPLLVISILSIPLMYFVSFFKNRERGKQLVTLILGACMTIFYVFIVFVANMSDETEESLQAVSGILTGFSKVGVYNYSIVQAMSGENSLLNFVIYLGGLIAIFGIVLLISAVFYRKGLSVMIEGSSATSRKKRSGKKENSYVKTSFFKTLVIKELRSLFGNAQLLLACLIGIVMIPLISFGMSKTFASAEEGNLIGEMAFLGIVSYFVSIAMTSSGTFSCIAFSLERQNICILKTLPIRPKDILNAKMIVTNIINVFIALIGAVCYVATSKFHNVLIGFCLLIVLILNGLAVSCIGLYNDLKKPNFKFSNINELTRNNTRILKPMLINIAICFLYLVLGIVLSAFDEALTPAVAYLIFFLVLALVNGLFLFISGKKLYDNIDNLFERTEP